MTASSACPTCGNAVGAEDAFCGVCYHVLRKAPPSTAAASPSPPAVPSAPPLPPWVGHAPWAAGLAGAALFAWKFADYLPITDGWMRVKGLYPTGLANFLFHEGGHLIFSVLGFQFLTVAAGSALQLALPLACAAHLYFSKSPVGALLCLMWTGQSLVDLSFYIADAKQQVLILITGTSGSEGSFHDWAYLLDCFGLRAYAVGLGRLAFFAGCWLGLWAPLEAGLRVWRDRRGAN